MDETETLSQIFEKCMNLFETLESSDLSTASDEFQNIVKSGINKLENATHLVNTLCMFSANENIDEVSTSHVKYLLLPALLGYFSDKLQSEGPLVRMERLQLVELYYKDFLQRCRNYEIPDTNIPAFEDDSKEPAQTHSDLNRMEQERQSKINNYMKMKQVESKMTQYKDALHTQDEEIVRNYFLLLLKNWVLRILEEIPTIKMEMSILKDMPKTAPKKERNLIESEKMKPIIIVRNEMQKKVYGMGYPSLPVMSVDEFYAQRYPEGKNQNPAPASQMNSLQNMALDTETAKLSLEAEEEEKENNADDPIALRNARGFDDWKDDNPRGAGNRKNRG